MAGTRKVLAVSYSFPPLTTSGSIRNFKLLKYLHQSDWDVHVLTIKKKYNAHIEGGDALLNQFKGDHNTIRTSFINLHDSLIHFKNNPSGKDGAGNAGKGNLSSNQAPNSAPKKSGSAWVSLKDFITNSLSVPDRMLGWLPFAVWNGILFGKKRKVDVVYAIGKPWTGLWAGWFIKAVLRKPLVVDLMDPWTQNPYSKSKGKFLDGFDLIIERFLLKRADFIVANTPELGENLHERLAIPREKIGVVGCGYDHENLPEIKASAPSHDKKFTITHTGNLYVERDPKNFFEAVYRLIDEGKIKSGQIEILLIGSLHIQEKSTREIAVRLEEMGILTTMSWVPHGKIFDYLQKSDLLLIVQPNTLLQIPAKIYEYLLANKPISALADKGSAIDNMLRRKAFGSTVSNDDTEAIYQELHKKFVDHQKGVSQGDRDIEEFSYKSLAEKLGRYLQAVT